MTNIQNRLIERYKGYKQKELYRPKKDILNEIRNNNDEYLLMEYAVDIYELKRFFNDI